MRILDFNATKKEIEISLSGWTRIGYISREINLSDNSYDEKKFDYNYSLSIKQIADFESIQSKINDSLSIFKVLSKNNNIIFPNEGKVLGEACLSKIERKKIERDIYYLWSNIYFHQELFESLEKSLSLKEKYRVTLEGLKYSEECTEGNDEKRFDQKFTITNIEFKSIE
jgi:hypothetical protein